VVGCWHSYLCLERGADLYIAQLMPLPLTVSCFSKIQIGFSFLVPAHSGSPGQRAVKRVCMCVSALERKVALCRRAVLRSTGEGSKSAIYSCLTVCNTVELRRSRIQRHTQRSHRVYTWDESYAVWEAAVQ